MIVLGVAASAGAQAKPAQPQAKPPQPQAKPPQPQAKPPQPPPKPGTTKPQPARPFDRFYISINGAVQTAEDFTETVSFTENAETGSFSTDYTVESGPALNISAGYAISRSFGVGVGVTRFSHSTPISLTASVPHPFFFNRARSVSGDVTGLTREEFAIHFQARGMFRVSPKIEGVVFGGPSFFSVTQGIVNDFEITETYPYDTAAFSRGLTTMVDESKIGFNVGADVGYFFTRQVGVGGSVQWAGTTIDAPASGGPSSGGPATFELKAGGLQFGGGLRLRF
jgi:hypothetical protein